MTSIPKIPDKEINPLYEDCVNITVVTYNRLPLTKICLESLLKKTRGNFCINIIDNCSRDDTWNYLSYLQTTDERVNIVRMPRNMGVAAAANYGWSLHPDLHYIKLDNDVEITNGNWLQILLAYIAKNQELAQIGYKFLEKHQTATIRLPAGCKFWEFETCGGACVLIPKHIHQKAGFWNEDYGKYGYEDMEYSLRCRLLGYKVGYAPLQNMVRHLGYDYSDDKYELNKKEQLKSHVVGEKIFFFNKFLFEEGIRPLKVERRFLPVSNHDSIHFKPNKNYASILKLHKLMKENIAFSSLDNKVVLDLNKLRLLSKLE